MQNRIPEPEKVSPYQLDQNMKIENHGADERIWYSPQRGPFQVSGFGWFHTERIYRRLPSVPDVYIRPEVDALANCTSGGQIRFRTNSRSVSVRVRLTAGSGCTTCRQRGSAASMRISAAPAIGCMRERLDFRLVRWSMRAASLIPGQARHGRSS